MRQKLRRILAVSVGMTSRAQGNGGRRSGQLLNEVIYRIAAILHQHSEEESASQG
jgi:hypothetical protein